MKRIILPFLSFILLATIALAQSPQAINYQAVARDNSGNLLTNKTIAIKISILTGSSSGTVEYSETFSSASTNGFGVFSLQIGTGNVVSGTFNTIKWESANHYLKVEMDASGGSSYTTMGTSQLVSVPYAMFANKSGSTDLSKSKLGDIGDVKGTFYKGQVLKWDGTNWSAANDSIGTGTGTGGGGVSALNDLTDVKAYPKKSQILKWNGSKWVAGNDSLGATQLNELSDVSASPKKGQVLKYNGTLWVAAGDTGAQQLNDLTDVSASPKKGQVLKYNGTLWTAQNDSVGSTGSTVSKLNDLSDVSTSPSSGQVLKYNGTKWVNKNDSVGATKMSDLTDVSATASKWQLLKWNGTKWVAQMDSIGATKLNDLSDVSASPKTGQVLKYNGSKWAAANDSVGTGAGGGSQWTTTGSDIYYAKGKVGIGNTAPAHNLDAWTTLPKKNIGNIYVQTKGNTNGDTASGIYSAFHGNNSSGNSRNVGISGYGYGNNYSGTTGANIGVYGEADSSRYINRGVYGRTSTNTSTASNQGVFGRAEGSGPGINSGVFGYSINGTGSNIGIEGGTDATGSLNYGLYGYSSGSGTTNYGLYATAKNASTNYAGFFDGNVNVGSRGLVGINALSPAGQLEVDGNIYGSTTVAAVFAADSGYTYTVGLNASGNNSSASYNRGIEASADGSSNINTGVYATVNSSSSSNYSYGSEGVAAGTGNQTYGVVGNGNGSATYNIGVYGAAGTNGSSNYAGYFYGDVYVNGTLSKAAGSFKIDHPLDPENKYLIHSFVESPDMMNVYNGNVTTDANGDATVTLPDYFMSLNKDYRYQLTVIGTFAQAIVFEKVKDNHFKIKTDKPNVEVSWQVTGIRQDAYAKAHPIIPEVEKKGVEKGRYLNPVEFGKPANMGMLTTPQIQTVSKNDKNIKSNKTVAAPQGITPEQLKNASSR